MFRVTEVSWHCSDACVSRDPSEMRIVEAETSTAPQGDMRHPIDGWWICGADHRTPFMTGTTL